MLEAKQGHSAAKGAIVKVLSNKGTLDPLDAEVLHTAGRGGRKGSGFRRAITADIDAAALSQIPNKRKTIPKAKLRLLPFHSEIVDDLAVFKSPLVLVLQCEEGEEDYTSESDEKFFDTPSRLERLMVQVIDTVTSEESHFVINMREFGIFYEEMLQKYENMSPADFDLTNRAWWKENIRKFIVVKPRTKKTHCDCKSFFFKVSKSAIERHICSEIQSKIIAEERARFHSQRENELQAKSDADLKNQILAQKAQLAAQLYETNLLSLADKEARALRESEKARAIALQIAKEMAEEKRRLAAFEAAESQLMDWEDELVRQIVAEEVERIRQEALLAAAIAEKAAESARLIAAEETAQQARDQEFFSSAEAEMRNLLIAEKEVEQMAAAEEEQRLLEIALLHELSLEQQPESEEDVYAEDDNYESLKPEAEESYDEYDEDNKSAEYSNDMDVDAEDADDAEDEPLSQSNQENLDMMMTGFMGGGEESQDIEEYILFIRSICLTDLVSTIDQPWTNLTAVLSIQANSDFIVDDVKTSPQTVNKSTSVVNGTVLWDAAEISLRCKKIDILNDASLKIEILTQQEGDSSGSIVSQANIPIKKLHDLLGSDMEIVCPLCFAADEFSKTDDEAEVVCGNVAVNAKLIPFEAEAPPPFEQGFLRIKSISVVGLKSLNAVSIDSVTPFVQVEVNGFSTRTSVSELTASTAVWSDLSVDAAIDSIAIKSRFIFVQVWSKTDKNDGSIIGVALIPLMKTGFVVDTDVELTGFLHSQQGIYCGVLKMTVQLVSLEVAVENEARTTLTKSVEPGDAELFVASQDRFEVGMQVVVGAGTRQEIRVLSGFGSLLVDTGLLFFHPNGTTIRGIPPKVPDAEEVEVIPPKPLPLQDMYTFTVAKVCIEYTLEKIRKDFPPPFENYVTLRLADSWSSHTFSSPVISDKSEWDFVNSKKGRRNMKFQISAATLQLQPLLEVSAMKSDDDFEDTILGFAETSLSELAFHDAENSYFVDLPLMLNGEVAGKVKIYLNLNSEDAVDEAGDDDESLCDMVDMSEELQSVENAFGSLDDAMNYVNLISERQLEELAESVAEMVLEEVGDSEIYTCLSPAMETIVDSSAIAATEQAFIQIASIEDSEAMNQIVAELASEIYAAEVAAAVALEREKAIDSLASMSAMDLLAAVCDQTIGVVFSQALVDTIEDMAASAIRIVTWVIATEELEIAASKTSKQMATEEAVDQIAALVATDCCMSISELEYMLAEHVGVQEAVEKQISLENSAEVLATIVAEMVLVGIISDELSTAEISTSRIMKREEDTAQADADARLLKQIAMDNSIEELAEAASRIAIWVVASQELNYAERVIIVQSTESFEAAEIAVSGVLESEEVDDQIRDLVTHSLFAATTEFLAAEQLAAEIVAMEKEAREIEAAERAAHEKAVDEMGLTVSNILTWVLAMELCDALVRRATTETSDEIFAAGVVVGIQMLDESVIEELTSSVNLSIEDIAAEILAADIAAAEYAAALAAEAARVAAEKVAAEQAVEDMAEGVVKIVTWVVATQELHRLETHFIIEAVEELDAAELAVSVIFAEEIVSVAIRNSVEAAKADVAAEVAAALKAATEKALAEEAAAEWAIAQIVAAERALDELADAASKIATWVVASEQFEFSVSSAAQQIVAEIWEAEDVVSSVVCDEEIEHEILNLAQSEELIASNEQEISAQIVCDEIQAQVQYVVETAKSDMDIEFAASEMDIAHTIVVEEVTQQVVEIATAAATMEASLRTAAVIDESDSLVLHVIDAEISSVARIETSEYESVRKIAESATCDDFLVHGLSSECSDVAQLSINEITEENLIFEKAEVERIAAEQIALFEATESLAIQAVDQVLFSIVTDNLRDALDEAVNDAVETVVAIEKASELLATVTAEMVGDQLYSEILDFAVQLLIFDKQKELSNAMETTSSEGNDKDTDVYQYVSTLLSTDVHPGSTKLDVDDHVSFEIGMIVEIGEGANKESHVLLGFGSLILATPIRSFHAAGTQIRGFKDSSVTISLVKAVATNLRNVEVFGSSDPYLMLALTDNSWQTTTPVISGGGANVEWIFDSDTKFSVTESALPTTLNITIMDKNSFRNDSMIGKGQIKVLKDTSKMLAATIYGNEGEISGEITLHLLVEKKKTASNLPIEGREDILIQSPTIILEVGCREG